MYDPPLSGVQVTDVSSGPMAAVGRLPAAELPGLGGAEVRALIARGVLEAADTTMTEATR